MHAAGSKPSSDKRPTAALLLVDSILLKATGASRELEFRNIERRLEQILTSSFTERAEGAIDEAERAVLSGKTPEQIEHIIELGFASWPEEVSGPVEAVVEESYRGGRVEMFDKARRVRKSRVSKAGPEFGVQDHAAMEALRRNQMFWVGQSYDKVLRERISWAVNDTMLRDGLGRREAGKELRRQLGTMFGIEGDQQGANLKIPGTWKGTPASYFEGLAANTVTVARAQGALNSLIAVGAVSYDWVNPDDERTCERCRYMDQRTFPVKSAQTRMAAELAAETPDDVKRAHPWPVNVGQLRTADEAGDLERFATPPLHFKCRCHVDISESTEFIDGPIEEAPQPTLTAPEPVRPQPMNRDDAEAWGDQVYRQWYYRQLTYDHKDALQDYTDDGYIRINLLHRRGVDGMIDAKFSQKVIDELITTSDNLDAALALAPRTPEDILVYRGMRNMDISQFQPGTRFVDKGYVSTSMNKGVSDSFGGSASVRFEIHVPKGSQGAYMVGSDHPEEQEFLLPRGSTFRILEVLDQGTGGKLVKVILEQ